MVAGDINQLFPILLLKSPIAHRWITWIGKTKGGCRIRRCPTAANILYNQESLSDSPCIFIIRTDTPFPPCLSAISSGLAARSRWHWALSVFSCRYCRPRRSYCSLRPAGRKPRRVSTAGCTGIPASARWCKTGSATAPYRGGRNTLHSV